MELHALRKHGWTIRSLARELGLNWRAAKRDLGSGEVRWYPERATRQRGWPGLHHVRRPGDSASTAFGGCWRKLAVVV